MKTKNIFVNLYYFLIIIVDKIIKSIYESLKIIIKMFRKALQNLFNFYFAVIKKRLARTKISRTKRSHGY